MKDEPVFEYHSDEAVISFTLPDSSKKSVKIKPGWSFGTGSHETTRLCIGALEEVFRCQNTKNLLDIGCGSGVLSLCAASMGAENVVGVDIDSSIIEEARVNAQINGLSENTNFSTERISEINQKFDLIIANILLDTIEGLLPQIPRILKEKGFFIVSGIRSEDTQKAIELFSGFGFELRNQNSETDWAVITLQE